MLTFLSLPPELRLKIYEYVLNPEYNRIYSDPEEDYTGYNLSLSHTLLLVNRQIWSEAVKVARMNYVSIRVETPWPQARLHVSEVGNVPMLLTGKSARTFSEPSLVITIDAPEHTTVDSDGESFVMLLDDLPRFTRLWHYADLSYPSLNPNLRATLELKAPYTPAYEEKQISKKIQRQMIMPFGEVKNLYETRFVGDIQPYTSIVKEMRAIQAQRHKTPEQYLRESAKLKEEGNAKLKAKQPREALRIYKQAWEAMCIVVRGRERFEHGNEWFSKDLTEPPFKGKNGQAERLYLRIELVAKTCQAYYELKEYKEAEFWGDRSISKLREAMQLPDNDLSWLRPQDEAIPESRFPGVSPFGHIYKWTGLAKHELGQVGATRLLEVARIYLEREGVDEGPEIAAILD